MNKQHIYKFFLDLIVWGSATPIAYLFLTGAPMQTVFNGILDLIFIMLGIKGILLYATSQYERSWTHVGFADVIQLVRIVGGITLSYGVIVYVLGADFGIPLTMPLLEFIIALPAMVGMRMLIRYVYVYRGLERRRRRSNPDTSQALRRLLVVGAGDAGAITVREMLKNPESGLLPVGFLDDDRRKRNKRILDVPVLGNIRSMSSVCKEHAIDEIVISMPSQSGETIRYIVAQAQRTGLPYRIIPGFYDVITGKVSIEKMRNVDLEDLLKREPVKTDRDSISAYIKGKIILVTGAGGSIGSEIVRQILTHAPKTVVLLGRGENSLHDVLMEIRSALPEVAVHARICDVRDRVSLESVFREFYPDVVFHAAAHKHVTLMEQNPAQAVFNNIFGTRNVMDLCLEYQVRRMVNISTDKAVNPTSVMGVTKRVSEMIVNRASEQAREGQMFISVRFGNVLGSRGSVVPIFREQIRKGGPVTVTHPDMVRYFMTIPEAAQLVLQSGAIARNGLVYVLDMGEPVNILDMARDLIRLSGFEPDHDIKIVFTGVQPGEKMFEELLTRKEGLSISQHQSIFIANTEPFNAKERSLDDALDRLLKSVIETLDGHEDDRSIERALTDFVPGFRTDVKMKIN